MAEQGIGPVLGAISQAGSIVKMLQTHYMKAIASSLEEAPQIAQVCSKGFAAMLRAVEDRIIGTLEASITDFFKTVSTHHYLLRGLNPDSIKNKAGIQTAF